MTKVAVWCRHKGDDIIGAGSRIPWDVPSDKALFAALIKNQNVVMGRRTYESLPGHTLPECQILVLTSDYKYKISDKDNHTVVENIRDFVEFEEDIYIAGGAKVYEAFMCGSSKLMPDIVVDCIYTGELKPELKGEKVCITSCIDVLNKKYFKVAETDAVDDVVRTVYIKRGDFVDQAVLKSILNIVEKNNFID